jgi:hypothetical protein
VLAVAAASLTVPWALAFDPQAWLVWGRELPAHGLQTENGPSWKPLPVLVTVPLAFAGDAAPAAWTVVARAGALLAVLGAWRLGRILAGRAGAVAAAGLVVVAPWWLYNAALANSEGWLAAAVLWAVAAQVQGRTTLALVLGTAAGLLRPEIWPFLGAYGVWAWRRGARGVPLACAAVLLVAWFAPDVLWGAGAVSAGDAARATASPSSAANADVPVLAVLGDAVTGIGVLACLLAAVGAWRSRLARAVAALGVAYVVLVAVSTAAGWAGNPRYLVPGLALLAVVAGAGAASLPRPRLVVAVLLAVTLAGHWSDLRAGLGDVGDRDAARRGLDEVLAAAGGAAELRRCGPVRTAPLTRALVALRADVPLPDVEAPARGGSTLLPPPPSPLQDQTPIPERGSPGQDLVARAGGWAVWSACPVGSRHGPPRG